jgi:hypothetical protein
MSEPQSDCSDSYGSEEVPCELVVSGCDSAEVLELVEEALDEVAQAVDGVIDGSLVGAVALGRDVRLRSVLGNQLDDCPGVVAAIGDGVAGRLEAIEQGRNGSLVGGLARCQHEPDRQAVGIDDDVDLGAQSSTRTADGVIRAPFFPPAAC